MQYFAEVANIFRITQASKRHTALVDESNRNGDEECRDSLTRGLDYIPRHTNTIEW